jgi:hypothetical protein
MTMTEEKKKTKKKGNMWHIHAFLVKKKKFEKVLYNQKVKPKCTVLPASCIMMITPHIMTHDTTLIVLTPLSHGTHFTFTFSTLSLSLYSISSLCFSSSSREEVVEDVEEKKEEEGEGVLRRDHTIAFGA